MITQQQLVEVFDYHEGILYWKTNRGNRIKAGDAAGCLHHSGYVQIRIDRKSYLAHRLIFLWHYGYLPPYIDHIDRNRSNNRIENLREATKQQNQGNRVANKNNTTSLKGVYLIERSGKWGARIGMNGSCKKLGTFTNKEDAYLAYCNAAKEKFGVYACL